MTTIPIYDLRHDGTPPDARTVAWLAQPHVLRARATIRLSMAAQDACEGDTLAAHRNQSTGFDMLARADRSDR